MNSGPLEPWRLIFLLIGLLSCFCGAFLVCILVTMSVTTLIDYQYFFLPDSPTSVKWLNEREKAIAVQRVAEGQTGVKNSMWPLHRSFVISSLITPLLRRHLQMGSSQGSLQGLSSLAHGSLHVLFSSRWQCYNQLFGHHH